MADSAVRVALCRSAWQLLEAAADACDDEGLLPWRPEDSGAIAPDLTPDDIAQARRELSESLLVVPYRVGRERRQLGWFVPLERSALGHPPQPSVLPPPSFKNGLIWRAYLHRDCYLCHLCGGKVNGSPVRHLDPYDPRNEGTTRLNPSLDHLVARYHGGSDYPSNIKLAHDTCNKARRERPIGASPSRYAPDREAAL